MVDRHVRVSVGFGLYGRMERCREERLHHKGSTGVFCRFLEVCMATLRDVMKLVSTIDNEITGTQIGFAKTNLPCTRCAGDTHLLLRVI